MTAPAEEIVEQRSDLEPVTHYLCPACLPPEGQPTTSLCGTSRPQGQTGWGFQPNDCIVCRHLWNGGFTCRQCGYVKLPRGIG